MSANHSSIFHELEWFRRVIHFRILQSIDLHELPKRLPIASAEETNAFAPDSLIAELASPALNPDDPYGRLVHTHGLNESERIVLMLALVPHIQPDVLDPFFKDHRTEYGGTKGSGQKGFLPTGQTVLFILAGDHPALRSAVLSMFDDDHKFRKGNILSLETAPRGEPELNGVLLPSREITDLVTRDQVRPPNYGADFPARRITTEMSWEDLVLAPITKGQVEEVKVWLRHRERLFTELGMGKRVKPGYKILFYGSPGTGKTLTACLLGQYTQKHVFRIDLSMIVSKYIGETEKNLSKVFDKAEHSDWILFFDEADALFGSRTKVSSSHDRYANQEVSYLLQRIEDYNGIVILASNMKGNIDDAFMRRFSSVVHFPFPKPEERLQLWQRAFPEKLAFSNEVDLKKISEKYEMAGGNITNIVAWCALMALENGDMQVTEAMLREGMARELAKEGRTL